ncbi:MAG: FAD-dependent oxidoreductase, partial [Xanthomonadaceae bacterium]|nr:FAD-dependent oxidoreductase [Xanthomonadaceae bacterium]
MKQERIAVIGGGISGLASAWLLGSRHEVTLFERNHYVGGHSNTLTVEGSRGPVTVDTGFVVFNERNYPELTALFRHLDVASQDTDMTFSASVGDGRME